MKTAVDKRCTGFTLVEMTVVISLIALIAAVALPSAVKLFSAGSGAQAYNMLAAQLSSARALAIRNGTYTLVHVQPAHGDRDPELEGAAFAAIFERITRDEHGNSLEPELREFRLVAGYSPRRVPGRIAFGEIHEDWLEGDGERFDRMNEDEIRDFSTLNIIFAPDGRVVRSVEGEDPQFDRDSSLFTRDDGIWDDDWPQVEKPGVVAVGMFDRTELMPLASDPGQVQNYLNVNVRFIPINQYTGELFPRE